MTDLLRFLHPATAPGRLDARRAAALLAGAPGVRVEALPPGRTAPAGAGRLLSGADLLRLPAAEAALALHLPRTDPRWSFEDMARRPLASLPPGTGVVVGSGLGAALLLRARPDLLPVRAGAYPLPEETPVLAEGPFRGNPSGEPLDPAAFVPAPGTGLLALLPPVGGTLPPAVAALADADAATAAAAERAFLEGVGDLPAGASLGVHCRRKVSVLFALRAVLFLPGEAPRDLAADIPLADARPFARGFGRHLAGR